MGEDIYTGVKPKSQKEHLKKKKMKETRAETKKPFPTEGPELRWDLGVVLGAPGPGTATGQRDST